MSPILEGEESQKLQQHQISRLLCQETRILCFPFYFQGRWFWWQSSASGWRPESREEARGTSQCRPWPTWWVGSIAEES